LAPKADIVQPNNLDQFRDGKVQPIIDRIYGQLGWLNLSARAGNGRFRWRQRHR
jgi:hypothetical protein